MYMLKVPPPPEISPIAALLATNDPPEPHGEAIARQIIATSTARISECDELIKRLLAETGQVNEVLASLRSRRAEYENHAKLHRGVISTLRRLPSEILLEIFFLIALDGFPSDIWMVTEVCRRWRAIALATPALWSVFPLQRYASATTILSRLSRSFGRSHTLPFQLTIDFRESGGYPDFKFPVCPLQTVVLPHLRRITHLTVCTPQKPQTTFLSPSSPSLVKWDSLRSLRLNQVFKVSPRTSPITVFQHSPLLQDVEVTTCEKTRLSHMSELVLPWSQLRRFSAKRVALVCAFSVLQAAPMLEELAVELTLPDPDFNIRRFAHQSLSRLHVRGWFAESAEAAQDFLSHLILPSLSKLSVDISDLDHRIISDFVKQSLCKLTFLDIPGSHPLETDYLPAFRQLLSLLPVLTDLGLPFSLEFVQTTLPFLPSLVPQLHHLYLIDNGSTATEDRTAVCDVGLAMSKGLVHPQLETLILPCIDSLPLHSMVQDSAEITRYEDIVNQWYKKLRKVYASLAYSSKRYGATQAVDVRP
ncbi:hypothetical protein NLJ89_g7520 [Agrocybe chaxingu]|uniref:F-box domain-containing protein n=1 Tax=Agrocybe chaxingu TaxID=84603 RepID=A0A9W8MVD1_9AGAR|nr:hypothetical protein NLJ89_g7520 [Agrocybe chaxingu]